MRVLHHFRPSGFFIALTVLCAIVLPSCPPPPPGEESLKVILATGTADLARSLPKALVPVPDGDILNLKARIQSIRILPADSAATDPVVVFTGPVDVDLLSLSSVAALLSSTTAPAGAYDGIELKVSSATMVRASSPGETQELVLAVGGNYSLNFSFEIAQDSSGLLYIELGGLNVFQQDDTSYLLAPELSADLREFVAETRIEGVIASIDATSNTFALSVGDARFTVDYNGAAIFLPTDFLTPSGTSASLVAETQLAVTGSVGLDQTIAPDMIEILDLPGTPADENGDQVEVCYFYGEDPVVATTITVSRGRLEGLLAQGAIEGPCDGAEPFTLDYAAGPGGTLSGEASQSVVPGADGTPVTAVPDDGFAFVNWSDGSTLNPRTEFAVGTDLSVTANFAALFTLSYTAGAGGTLAGNTSQLVPEGGSGSPVTAVRNDSFVFEGWSDGSTDNPRTDINVTADLSVTANFREIFQINYTAGAGGSLEGIPQQSVLAGADGSAVTAVPADGFVFIDWSDGSTDNPRTDLDVAADVTVTANFLEQFTLTYSAGPNGSLTGNISQIVNAGGDASAVTAVPADGFGFLGWSDGRTDNPRVDTDVDGDVAVTASFADAVLLTYAAGPNGSVTGSTDQVIGSGGTGMAVTAVPNEGFGFDRWSDERTDNPRVDTGVTADLSVTATFVPAYTLNYAAGANGALTGATSQVVNAGASGTPVTAVPNQGFAFREWSDGSTRNPRTDTDVRANLSLTAGFIQLFTLKYSAGPNGTVTGPVTQSVRLGSSGRAVSAVPNTGFGFVSWSDGRTDNPRADLAVNANVTVTANFGTSVTLTYVAAANGSITGETTQVVTAGGAATPVLAVPDEGYLFLQWDDGITDNPRTDTDVNSVETITATFFRDVEMVTVPAGTFTMGATTAGDDASFHYDDELPRRDVTLAAYEIGKYEVTNEQFAAFMNYLHHPSRDLLKRPNGDSWGGFPENAWLFDTALPRVVFAFSLTEDGIDYDHGSRSFVSKQLEGLPVGTIHDKSTHPVTEPTWFGAVLFANWLSERKGLEPVYNVDTWEADFTRNGYRLPTEAEWERAASWDGAKHWTYPFLSDTLTTRDRANFHVDSFRPNPDYDNPAFINPLGIVQDGKESYTSPVGWFNGVNISPNGNVQTVDSPSPVGCYDMAGNTVEWCQDWYSETYYGENVTDNPMGPAVGTTKVARGGAWARLVKRENQRTARRFDFDPNHSDGINGFRLAR